MSTFGERNCIPHLVPCGSASAYGRESSEHLYSTSSTVLVGSINPILKRKFTVIVLCQIDNHHLHSRIHCYWKHHSERRNLLDSLTHISKKTMLPKFSYGAAKPSMADPVETKLQRIAKLL